MSEESVVVGLEGGGVRVEVSSEVILVVWASVVNELSEVLYDGGFPASGIMGGK